jgi:hypothetical protein
MLGHLRGNPLIRYALLTTILTNFVPWRSSHNECPIGSGPCNDVLTIQNGEKNSAVERPIALEGTGYHGPDINEPDDSYRIVSISSCSVWVVLGFPAARLVCFCACSLQVFMMSLTRGSAVPAGSSSQAYFSSLAEVTRALQCLDTALCSPADGPETRQWE